MFSQVPVGRRVSDTLYMAPGVSTGGSVGSANPSISGGSGLENQYVIDGVNVTNQGYGALGSYSIVFGSLGNATPFDFVKEVQVKTGGYEAEFGQATGGVVNVVTKSGSNDVRGSVFGYARPTKTRRRRGRRSHHQRHDQHRSERTSAMPASRAAVRSSRTGCSSSARSTRRGRPGPSACATRPAFPLLATFRDGSTGTAARLSYSAKGTFQLSDCAPLRRVVLRRSVEGRQRAAARQRAARSRTRPASARSTTAATTRPSATTACCRATSCVEAILRARAEPTSTKCRRSTQWRVTDTTVDPERRLRRHRLLRAGNRSLNNQYSVKSTNIFGGHQLKYGVEYDDVDYSNINQRTGPTFTAPDGRQTATGAQHRRSSPTRRSARSTA